MKIPCVSGSALVTLGLLCCWGCGRSPNGAKSQLNTEDGRIGRAIAAEPRQEKVDEEGGLRANSRKPFSAQSGKTTEEEALAEIRRLRGKVRGSPAVYLAFPERLSTTEITDDWLARYIIAFPELQVLDIYEAEITDAGLLHLNGLSSLEELGLGRTRVTGAGVEQLKRLPNLKRLNLAGTQVDDAGAARVIKAFHHLERLDLEDTRVADAGLVFPKPSASGRGPKEVRTGP